MAGRFGLQSDGYQHYMVGVWRYSQPSPTPLAGPA